MDFKPLQLNSSSLPSSSLAVHLLHIKYVYVGLSLNELTGTTTEGNSGKCITNGDYTIKDLGLDYISNGGCIALIQIKMSLCQII